MYVSLSLIKRTIILADLPEIYIIQMLVFPNVNKGLAIVFDYIRLTFVRQNCYASSLFFLRINAATSSTATE